MGAPSLPMGIYGFLADDLRSASAQVHMSGSHAERSEELGPREIKKP